MAVVTVRAFGALRELVGDPHEVEARSVADLVEQLTRMHGREFTRRMRRATVAVDEATVGAEDDAPLPEGAEVVLLPPFAGG